MRREELFLDENRKSPTQMLGIDKGPILRIIEEQNRAMGIVPDPTITPQKVREMMVAQGVRPEDNIFSCGIIAARDEE